MSLDNVMGLGANATERIGHRESAGRRRGAPGSHKSTTTHAPASHKDKIVQTTHRRENDRSVYGQLSKVHKAREQPIRNFMGQ